MEHTSRHYENELQELKQEILYLGATVEEMIANAMKSLVQRDSDLARRVIETDRTVDSAEMAIDQLCLNILEVLHADFGAPKCRPCWRMPLTRCTGLCPACVVPRSQVRSPD